jgi:hypothetical protein
MAALQHLFHALAGQHVAELAGLEEFDAAAGRHRDLVVAVAGKGKGGVGQREDETAVADLVAVEVPLAHLHAQHGTARLAAHQLHAHGVLAGGVVGEHGLAHLAGPFGRLHHSPLNCAGRFSRKAITPSM